MKKLFIIGGMGAGKSTARKALVEQGCRTSTSTRLATTCFCGIR